MKLNTLDGYDMVLCVRPGALDGMIERNSKVQEWEHSVRRDDRRVALVGVAARAVAVYQHPTQAIFTSTGELRYSGGPTQVDPTITLPAELRLSDDRTALNLCFADALIDQSRKIPDNFVEHDDLALWQLFARSCVDHMQPSIYGVMKLSSDSPGGFVPARAAAVVADKAGDEPYIAVLGALPGVTPPEPKARDWIDVKGAPGVLVVSQRAFISRLLDQCACSCSGAALDDFEARGGGRYHLMRGRESDDRYFKCDVEVKTGDPDGITVVATYEQKIDTYHQSQMKTFHVKGFLQWTTTATFHCAREALVASLVRNIERCEFAAGRQYAEAVAPCVRASDYQFALPWCSEFILGPPRLHADGHVIVTLEKRMGA